MSDPILGELLLDLAALLGAGLLLGGLLARLRVPPILGALLVAMAAGPTPMGRALGRPELAPGFGLLASLGVLFLLLFIGAQIDLSELRGQGKDMVLLTVLNTVFPFLLGMGAMLALGYGWTLAFVIGMTRMPTAEAVVVPILDEFGLVRSRVGNFIVGAGVLDDVIEVFLVAFVSVWIGDQTLSATAEEAEAAREVGNLLTALGVLVGGSWVARRWLLRGLLAWLPDKPDAVVLVAVVVLFTFGGFSATYDLGLVIGAIVAGILMRPVFDRRAATGDGALRAIRTVTYGFLAPAFFLWVGMSVDLGGMVRAPLLAIVLFLAAFVGKLIGVFVMVPLGKMARHEAWIVGVGLNARLTTEIVVAKLLLDARLIDDHLFTALVAASSLSTLLVPLLFAWLLRRHHGALGASNPP